MTIEFLKDYTWMLLMHIVSNLITMDSKGSNHLPLTVIYHHCSGTTDWLVRGYKNINESEIWHGKYHKSLISKHGLNRRH